MDNKLQDITFLRDEINKIDMSLLNLIKQRMQVSLKIGEYKKKNNIPILDSTREKILIEKIIDQNNNTQFKLDEKFIKSFWNNIMSYSKKLQE